MTDAGAARKGVIILGASSAIAEAVARRLAGQGARLGLVARDPARLEAIAADLKVRGAANVATRALDLAQAPQASLLEGLAREMGGADTVLIAYGLLGDQAEAESDMDAARRLLEVNFTSAALWALAARQVLEASGAAAGLIVGLGSVAGDRGRKSNFIYGAAKGGLALMLQGHGPSRRPGRRSAGHGHQARICRHAHDGGNSRKADRCGPPPIRPPPPSSRPWRGPRRSPMRPGSGAGSS